MLLIDSRLKAEGKEKTIKHEKAEATIMATLRNLRRHRISNIDYDTVHLLTNRLDYIYGNTFLYKKTSSHTMNEPHPATRARRRRKPQTSLPL